MAKATKKKGKKKASKAVKYVKKCLKSWARKSRSKSKSKGRKLTSYSVAALKRALSLKSALDKAYRSLRAKTNNTKGWRAITIGSAKVYCKRAGTGIKKGDPSAYLEQLRSLPRYLIRPNLKKTDKTRYVTMSRLDFSNPAGTLVRQVSTHFIMYLIDTVAVTAGSKAVRAAAQRMAGSNPFDDVEMSTGPSRKRPRLDDDSSVGSGEETASFGSTSTIEV